MASYCKCFYCGIFHGKVEAQGMWYCPNALCEGPGAAWFRRTLDSYKEIDEGHTVDEKEKLKKGKIYNKKNKINLNN